MIRRLLGLCRKGALGAFFVAWSTTAFAQSYPGVESRATGASITSGPVNLSSNTGGWCGTTLILSGAAFYSVNVAAPSNFPDGCVIRFYNTDLGRGKKMNVTGLNGTFPNLGILWPNQTVSLRQHGSIWFMDQPPGRWKLTTSPTFFVDITNGNDNNDGLAAGAGNAWQHPNLAFVFMNQILDANAQVVTLQAAAGTYTGTINILDIPGSYGNGAKHIFQGDLVTPSNVVLTNSGANLVQYVGPANAYWRLQGFQLKAHNGACLQAVTNVWLFWQTVDFNDCSIDAQSLEYAALQADGAYTISAGGTHGNHILTTSHGYFVAQAPLTVTLSGTPNFTGAFASMDKGSVQEWNSGVVTFSGAITAGVKQWNAVTGGGINTGGGATVIPGSVAGTPAIGASSATAGWAN
jgi:hypothetical protein